MKENAIYPVILSGGSGERLWPLSRKSLPKQFLKLCSNHTLIQEVANRVNVLSSSNPLTVICNDDHRFLVTEQLKDIQINNFNLILEPLGRNTAPAIAIAALKLIKDNPDALLLILSADQVIQDQLQFIQSIKESIEFAENGQIVIFGIKPSNPNTNYGYIKTGEVLKEGQIFTVEKFVEKPDLAKARTYFESDNYFWNGGIFLFKANTFLEEMTKYNPEIIDICQKSLENSTEDGNSLKVNKEYFEKCPSISIDYALIEKTDKIVCSILDVGWSDIGSWSSLWEISPKDIEGNVTKGDAFIVSSRNNFIQSTSRLIATAGIDDLVIVETDDAILITKRGKENEIKEIVEELKVKKRTEGSIHTKAYRPWGHYEVLDEYDNFKVKRITVNPGGSLSLQMHYHRSEHWIVVKGTAEVTVNDSVQILSENQSTYIPIGAKHRLRNPGKTPLQLIEVQSGSYLEEDDIVRFEDIYGRNEVKN